MKRRDFTRLISLAGATAHPAVALLGKFHNLDEYAMKPLRGNVGYFTERGGTIVWMIEEGAAVVVDTQFPEQAGHLIEEMVQRNTRAIDYVINTHHHGDHTAGNVAFKELARNVLAHENSKLNQESSATERGNLDEILLPNMTFSKDWSSKIGNEVVTLNYWGAGHTNGDALVHFENANVVHVGDLVFNRRFPYIDKGAGASIENWISVLQRALKHYDDDTIFVCGHCAEGYDIVIDKSDIQAFEQYLANVLDFVGAEIKDGRSNEEIMEATAIPGSPEWSGRGIQRSLSAAISELRDEN